MLKGIVSLIMAVSVSATYAKDPEWQWLRVEAGIPSAVVMQGQATTVSEQASRWTLKFSDRERVVNDFVVSIRQTGKAVTAEFEPPNTERGRMQMKGIRREMPTGSGELFEEMIFADVKSGQFLLLSRLKMKSK
jgi:hypothetical protein